MFISKMNRMFHKHGRVAFALLTIVIIVPFVLYFSAAPSELLEMFDFSSKASRVEMYGSTVSKDDLDKAVMGVLVTLAAQGQNVDFSSMFNNEKVVEQAVNNIRLLKVANKRGIKADDIAVAAYIKQLPLFQVKGQFNVSSYKMFAKYYLERYGINENQFEEAVRSDIIINMLRSQITGGTIVTDSEVAQYFNDLNKTYDVQAARFNSKDFEKDVKVTDEALKQYFSENRSKYLIPAKYKIDVVRFNFINYEKEAEKQVTDNEIDVFYNAHKDEYKDKAEKDTKVEIKKQLVDTKAENIVRTDAQKFAVAVYKQIEQNTGKEGVTANQIFDKEAAKQNYTVHAVTDWISSDTEVIPRLGKVPEVTQVLNQLFMDQPISNAVQGSNAFFVVCLTDKVDPRQAEFDEVKDKITNEFKAHEAVKLAQNAAKKSYKTISESENTVAEFKTLNIKLEDIPVFSQKNYMPILNINDGIQIFQGVAETGKGKVSAPIDTEDGAILVYVKNVNLPDKAEFEKNKDAVKTEFKRTKEWLLWFNYQEMLRLESNTVIAEKE